MTLATMGEICGILAALAGVITLGVSLRSEARKRAQMEIDERKKIRDDAYASGVQSQTATITQLQYQRDQLTSERDEARTERRDLERQVAQLEAELRVRNRNGQ